MGFVLHKGIVITTLSRWKRIMIAVRAIHTLIMRQHVNVCAKDPMDTYATSKLCGERCARSFVRRFPGTDIYALRIGNIIEPHEYESNFPEYVNKPETRNAMRGVTSMQETWAKYAISVLRKMVWDSKSSTLQIRHRH